MFSEAGGLIDFFFRMDLVGVVVDVAGGTGDVRLLVGVRRSAESALTAR